MAVAAVLLRARRREHEAGAAALDRAHARGWCKLATPVAIGGGAQPISTLLDVVWASLLPAGTISALYYADRIAQLPLGVIGIAIGTALLPLLARQLRAGQEQSAMANQNRAIEFGLMFSLPADRWRCGCWPMPIDPHAVRARPLRPRRHAAHARARSRAYAVGLPAFMLVKALTPGFFAREDTRTPLYIATTAIIAEHRAQRRLRLWHPARPGRHCARHRRSRAGSMRGMLATVLRRRGHWLPDQRLISRSIRVAGATAGMGLVLWLALAWLAQPLAHANFLGVVTALGVCALGAAGLRRAGRARGRGQAVGAARRDAPPAWPQLSRPRRTTVTPGLSGRLDEGITSTQLS